MNLAGYAIRHKAVSLVFTLLVAIGGALSYGKIGRLEDPQFTIKTAVIFTQYPGATAEEVELEVTEKLETAVQQLKQLDEVRSISRSGLSIIYADVQDQYDKDTLPQVWDELRRKIGAAAADLPPGCAEPQINDDFGDVYGVFFAITGDRYSYHDLQAFAEDLRRELQLCTDVGRIDFWGKQTEVVYVEIERSKLAQLGLSPTMIFSTMDQQNTVTSAGDVRVDNENINLRVTGAFTSVEDLGELLVKGGPEGQMIRLKDVANIRRGYYEPATSKLRIWRKGEENGNSVPAIGLGISTIMGGNVVTMGDAIKEKLASLQERIPVGIEIKTISYQAETVRESVNGFVLNLVEAVTIVVLLLVIFMGLREGFIIGAVLLLTISGTFMAMYAMEVNLQRISLGALIIALGMLVDNAIVVAEGIVIKSHHGMDRTSAAEETVAETMWPLLGATFIAILAFAAISISKDVTGEFLGSLFKVIGVSLGLSWILAVTITPYLCVKLLHEDGSGEHDPHGNLFYRTYKAFLGFGIDHRWLSIATVAGILFAALYGFGFVSQNFFPDSSRPQFTVDIYYPEGTHIERTSDGMREIEKHIKSLDGVTEINSFIGQGAMRFILTYDAEMPNSAYGQLLVTVENYELIANLKPQVQKYIETHYPGIVCSVDAFKLGPGGRAVEARLMGPDAGVLRSLAEKVEKIMWNESNARTVQSDWGERVKIASVSMAEARAREIGVTRPEIAGSLCMNFSGTVAGLYRENEKLLPIILRPPAEQREDIDNVSDVQVWSAGAGGFVPLDQVADGVETKWEDPVIHRRNRLRTITVSCQQRTGTAITLFNKMRKSIEDIEMPVGYSLEWGGEYESSNDANRKLMANIPLTFALMFLTSVMLFNTLRHPVIIFLGLPLAIIGVSVGLLVSGQPFGFMAFLGFLSLSGMLIKNEIVLLEQINIEMESGKEHFTAVIDAAVSRVRPVCMAAFTTVLGMIPLIWDPFFAAMAVTIMSGLTFATVLTLVVVPILYSTLFGIHRPKA